MKRALAILALAALTACGGGGEGTTDGGIAGYGVTVQAPAAEPVKPSADCTVGLNGDSITFGYGLAVTPLMRLAEWRPKWKVTNRAVNGQAITEQILAFENTQLPERIQVIGWGTNDVNKKLDWQGPYVRALAHVKASGRVAIATGLYTAFAPVPEAVIVDRLITEAGAGSAHWEQIVAETQSPTDGHPAQAYSDLLWGRVVEVIDAVMQECKS